MPITFPGKASDFLKIGVAAAGRGDLDAVREILKAKPKWLHQIGSGGRTMLWEASHRGKLEMVKYLVKRKVDINVCASQYTPYFVDVSCYCIARFKKRHAVADYLLSKGAKLDIHTAAFLGDLDGVKQFLKRSLKRLNEGHPQCKMVEQKGPISQEIVSAPWATPLVYACRGADEPTVAYLIERGARIKGNEENLFIAAKRNPAIVRLLLENGADPALASEVSKDEGALFKVVSEFGGKKLSKQQCSEQLVYLCRGDRGGNPDEVRRLLKLGADVNHQDKKGKTSLHRAAKAGFVFVMEILLEHGAEVDAADKNGETPLFDVVRSTIKDTARRKKAMQLLLREGADRSHANRKDQLVLEIAERNKLDSTSELVRLLKRKK